MKHFLVLSVLALLALPEVSIAGQELDSLDDPEESDSCPQHCTCMRGPGEGMVVRCDMITPTTWFQDPVAGFHLERNEDHPVPGLVIGKRFFVDLGMKNIDSITITVDIASIDRDAFQGLNDLSFVNLTNNNLKSLHPETFASNKNLRQLSLSTNPLTLMQGTDNPAGVLLNIPNLRELDISSCQIYNLPPNAFEKLPELIYINLASNYVVDIDVQTFGNLKSLEELDLSNNNIRVLNPDLFLNNEVLNVLRLSYNPLTTVENIKLPGVTKLELDYCKFTKLTSTSFDGFAEVLLLNLTGNAISELSLDSFSKLTRLLHLDLSNNKLGPLDEKLFVNNPELETLILRDNPTMGLWPLRGFQGQFQNLYRLDISNTGIHTFTPNALKNMSYLAQLDLSRNSIKTLEAGVLPRKIKFLSLSYNNITSLNDVNFPKEFQVRHLFLQGNQIKSLNQSNFSNLPYLGRLDLSSCGLEKIWSRILNDEPYLQKVRKLDLSKNKLQKISSEDLKVFSQLQTLDIRGNPFVCNDDLHELLDYLRDSAIEPIGQSDVGNIDENVDRFLWEDVWAMTCNRQRKEQYNHGGIEGKQTRRPTSPPRPTAIPPAISGGDTKTYDDDEDDDDDDNDEEYNDGSNIDSENEFRKFDYDQYIDDSWILHHKPELNPDIVRVSRTSPFMIAFLSALGMTLVMTLLIALVIALCKRKIEERVDMSNRRRNRSSSYQQLHNNEHQNVPTTPIVKTKAVSTLSQESASNDAARTNGYNRTVGHVTYLSSDFHHSNITPETV